MRRSSGGGSHHLAFRDDERGAGAVGRRQLQTRDTGEVKKRYLTAAEVAELAELLEDEPRRVGVTDQVLQAAADGRGVTLLLGSVGIPGRGACRSGSDPVQSGHGHARR